MQPAALRIDPRPVAQIAATMLQAFRRAGARLSPPPSVAHAAYENRNATGNSSPKAGLHLSAPVHAQTSAPTSGEHRTSIRAAGQGPAIGLASGANPPPGPRPGPLGHPDGQPPGFPALGRRSFAAESGRGVRSEERRV